MDDPKKPNHDLRQTLPTMADEGGGFDPANDVTIPDYVDLEHDIPTLPAGTQVGKYTIEKVLGIGGMGAVYQATQSKPQRKVALKLIRPGVLSSKSIRRFDLEAEILGRLHHPNIAQIHEAGIDQETGSPYFAMEHVEGQELGDYVKEQKLSVRAQLELFVKLCDAIQHAHAKGVIHRDLKPGNVLVTANGEPKVLDFGVARATDSSSPGITLQTNVGQLIGTLYYMSPEQAIGDSTNLDTRSDVYALGVVLFEMLTGEIPYDLKDKAIHEAVRVIQETSPTKLSKFDQSLKGDIEIVVGKALVKDKDRRYQTVADFSADIRRMLANQPITARPPSMVYKTTKFVQRNKGMTLAAACFLILIVVGGSIVTTQMVQRIEERQLALQNMLTTLNEMDVQKGEGPALAKRLLDLYSDHGETLFSSDQESLAIFYTNLGNAYHDYEDFTRALSAFEMAYSIRIKLHSPPHPAIAEAIHNIASAEFFLEDLVSARTHYQEALTMREQLVQPDGQGEAVLATTIFHLGSTSLKLEDFDTALKYCSRAKYIQSRLFGADSLQVAQINNTIANCYMGQEQYLTAEAIFRDLFALLQALPVDNRKPKWEAMTLHSLGGTLIKLERYDEAIVELTEALKRKQHLVGDNTDSVAETQHSLSVAYDHRQEYDNAIFHAKEAVRIRELLPDEMNIESAKKHLDSIESKAAQSASDTNSG